MSEMAAPKGMLGLPKEIYALFVVRLVVSAGAFVGPFLAMMLTMKLGYDDGAAGVFMAILAILSAGGLALGGKQADQLRAVIHADVGSQAKRPIFTELRLNLPQGLRGGVQG